MTEIKPCPFCGRRAFTRRRPGNMADVFYVYCGNSSCEVEPQTHAYFTRERAIEAWNRRPTNDRTS